MTTQFTIETATTTITIPMSVMSIETPVKSCTETSAQTNENDYVSYVRKIIGTPPCVDWMKVLGDALIRDYGLVMDIDKEQGIYLLKMTEKSDTQNAFVARFRGVIGLGDDPYRIVSMTLPITMNVKEDALDVMELRKTLTDHEIHIFPLFDATLIRVIRQGIEPTDIGVSTNRKIDAQKSHWISSKSYYEMFQECVVATGFNIADIKEGKTYLFLLFHPENKMVLTYPTKSLLHLMTIDNKTAQEVPDILPIPRPVEITNIRLDDVFAILNINIPLNSMFIGYIVKDKTNGKTYRFDTATYTTAKHLQYNLPNLLCRFIKNYQEDTIQQYFVYYPEHFQAFSEYYVKLMKMIDHVFDLYKQVHIMRGKVDEKNMIFSRFLYDIHGYYLQTLKPQHAVMTREIIVQIVKKTDLPRMSFLMTSFTAF